MKAPAILLNDELIPTSISNSNQMILGPSDINKESHQDESSSSSDGGQLCGSSSSSSLATLTSSSSGSRSSSISSDLVQDALDNLNLRDDNDDLEQEEASRIYNVIITDMETGIIYNLSGVRLFHREGEDLSIRSEQFNFTSDTVYKGRSACQVLLSQFGPSFANQDLIVYEGTNVSFKYQDLVYKPRTDKSP